IVDAVCGACETEIQVLPNHEQTSMEFDGDAGSIGNDVLPAELIGDPEPIVGIGIHQIESVVNAIYWILVAASKVVADEDARHTSQRTKPITDANCGSPCLDIVAPSRPTLPDHLQAVVEIAYLFTPHSESKGLFIESPCLDRGDRFDCDTRRHS